MRPLPRSLLTQWARHAQECFRFGFFGSPRAELHLLLPEAPLPPGEGHLFTTEALAGTIRRSGMGDRRGPWLPSCWPTARTGWRTGWFTPTFSSRLAPHDRCHPDQSRAFLKLRLLQHLKCDIEAELQTRRLRLATAGCPAPHPAVGRPEAALAFIRECEPHDRGWYAGACGMLSRETSEFSVAIRSARIRGPRISLFAGAGMVAGSGPPSGRTRQQDRQRAPCWDQRFSPTPAARLHVRQPRVRASRLYPAIAYLQPINLDSSSLLEELFRLGVRHRLASGSRSAPPWPPPSHETFAAICTSDEQGLGFMALGLAREQPRWRSS